MITCQGILVFLGVFIGASFFYLHSSSAPVHYYYIFLIGLVGLVAAMIALIRIRYFLLERWTVSRNTVSTHANGLTWMFLWNKGLKDFEYGYGDQNQRNKFHFAVDIPQLINGNPKINHGHADWRLPTRDELKTLLGTENTTLTGEFWTAETRSQERVWVLNFDRKRVYSVWGQWSTCNVALVRGRSKELLSQ